MAEVEEKVTLYHYTSKDSCIDILNDDEIIPSLSKLGTAALGNGVYLTALPPETEDKTLSANNYDGDGSEYFIRLEVAIKVELPKDEVTQIEGADGRDIWLVESVSEDDFVQIVVRTGKTIKSYSIKDFRKLYIPDNK